jgi:hypothetical protein
MALEMVGHDCAHVLPAIQKPTHFLESTETAGTSKETEGNCDVSYIDSLQICQSVRDQP